MESDAFTIKSPADQWSHRTLMSHVLFCRPNTILRLRFNHFATECSWDHLYVYDGDSIYAPLLAAFRLVSKLLRVGGLLCTKPSLSVLLIIITFSLAFDSVKKILKITNFCNLEVGKFFRSITSQIKISVCILEICQLLWNLKFVISKKVRNHKGLFLYSSTEQI